MDKVKYILVEMVRGSAHPKAIFFFPTGIEGCKGQHKYDQIEMVLDTNELSEMFDEAVMGLVPDVLTTKNGVGVQYNMDYTYTINYVGDK